ncbi:substrate-binding domain-containing protein [Epidermidibacterium keratini]|uniref:Substrate-binding domain-containing protein n=1 Tax=Epidermidibacterium keratini TaxID=1891644 RepID=A0A7L4YMA1_9ACTN|nr:LacI family DNA-binding transcriptional regulator [Epidermidibacterium keratini]QHC00411.1 substrate-binding domain-containing protein [Epidermidibacterium keratini]
MTERPTIKDVARLAGVSIATASRALSGTRPVQPAYRERVTAAAAELDYNPNLTARALRSAKTGAIGMVIPMIDNPFFPSLVSAIESLLETNGYTLLLCSSQENIELEAQRLRALTDRQVDGLLISAASQTDSVEAVARTAELVPLVQLDQRAPGVASPFVGIDDSAGMRSIVEHLASRGSRRTAYLGASDENWSGMRRRDGFVRWTAESDPSARERIRLGSFTREFGRSGALELLRADREIDALVCANDLIALGALDAAHELGLSVPGDVAVTGYDDIIVATASNPTLTTVAQPVADIARIAVETLWDTIGRGANPTADARPTGADPDGSAGADRGEPAGADPGDPVAAVSDEPTVEVAGTLVVRESA